jgi:hypothetical protein
MRKAFVPEFWIISDLGDAALRTIMVLALHKDKQDHCYLTNEKLAGILNKDARRVRSDLLRAEQLSLISRKYTDRGKRYFLLLMNDCTEDAKRPEGTEDVQVGGRKTSGGADAERPGGRTICVLPPNNPHIGTTVLNNLSKQQTERGGDGVSDTECVSLSTASLPPTEPKQEAPPEVIRMATQLQLKSWIGQVKFQNILLSDWRVKETLSICHSQGGRKSGRYAWGVFKNLPEEKPRPETNGYSSAAVSHVPNLQPKPRQADPYELVFTKISNEIADAKWPIEIKSRCLDKLFTIVRVGSADSYRVKLEKVIEEVKDDVQ